MFGLQLNSGDCGCGCSSAACIQARNIQGYIATAGLPVSASAGDAENMRDWLNNIANFPCGGWPSGNAGWESGWSAAFDTISDTSPDLGTVSNNCAGAQLPGGSSFGGGGYYDIVENGGGNATTESAITARYLISASTAYIVGLWCDGETNTMYYQQSCVMTGTSVGSCYQYIVPVPPSDLVIPSTSNACAQAAYFLVPASDPGGWFGQTWSGIVAGCADSGLAYPCAGSFSTSSGACMSGDPFFGDDP
jgi:hypothetical protein